MEEEAELEKIFNDKLFIKKKDSVLLEKNKFSNKHKERILNTYEQENDPLCNIENKNPDDHIITANKDVLQNHSPIQTFTTNDLLNYTPEIKSHAPTADAVFNFSPQLEIETNPVKETSLEGIYQNLEPGTQGFCAELNNDTVKSDFKQIEDCENNKSNLNIQKNLSTEDNNNLIQNEKRVTFQQPAKKVKLHEIEEEFERLRKIHFHTLQLKSKAYKFIYSELERMEMEYVKKINDLQEENKNLKIQLQNLNSKYQRYKTYISENLKNLKDKIVSAMRNYRIRLISKPNLSSNL